MVANINNKAVNLLAIWAETLLHGVYTSLFFESLFIVFRYKEKRAWSSNVFNYTTILMYVTATTHVAFGLVRLLNGYVYVSGPEAIGPYFRSKTWEHTAYTACGTIMAWLAQLLLIYRCHLVWNNFLYIIPSILIFLTSFGVGIFTNIMWAIPGGILKYRAVSDAVFPLLFAQNVWTTGLIAYRLTLQQAAKARESSSSSSSRLNLKDGGIIILESAALYTVVLALAMIFHGLNSNIQYICISIAVPIIGIVFSLMTCRLHTVTSRTQTRSLVFNVGPQSHWSQSGSASDPDDSTTSAGGVITPATADEQQADSIKSKPSGDEIA